MMSYFTKVNEINLTMLEAGKGKFVSFDVKATQEGVQAYGVRCGEKNFVYLYSPTAVDGNTRLTDIVTDKKKGNLTIFDCETGKYNTAKFKVIPDKSIKIDQLKLQPKSAVILSW